MSEVAARLRDAGVNVLVSNADHLAVTEQYEGFFHYRVERRSLIGGKGSERTGVYEALLSSYPLVGMEVSEV